jgi:hypothetical protein
VRKTPCSNCHRAQKPCEYKDPLPRRARPRKTPALGLHARVERYEQLLAKFGVNFEDATAEGGGSFSNSTAIAEPIAPSSTNRQPHGTAADQPFLTPSDGDETIQASALSPCNTEEATAEREHSMPLEDEASTPVVTNGFWRRGISSTIASHGPLSDQDLNLPSRSNIGTSNDQRHPEDSSFLFGSSDDRMISANDHPNPVLAMRLWKVFQENVDPLVKLFHVPTIEKLLHRNVAKAHVGQATANVSSLFFSIYRLAIISLSDSDALTTTGEAKEVLLKRYRRCCEAALGQASFLRTSDVMVLQAFTLFLLAERLVCDGASMWIMSGMAVRMGRRMGLHKEGEGSHLTTPFEKEMGRRLWWQIVLLDRTASEMSNIGVVHTEWEVRFPANLNDEDLDPDMQQLPQSREGATDMMFVLMRYELGHVFKTLKHHETLADKFDAGWILLKSPSASLAEKDRALAEITNRFETKFLRYCDPTVPTHLLVSITARSMLCMLYLATRQPWNASDQVPKLSAEENEKVYEKALKVIEYGSVVQRSSAMKGFLWRENAFFIWQPFILVLEHLVHASPSASTYRAWEQVKQVYEDRPTLLSDMNNNLHAAVRKLTLKAWNHREGLLRMEGAPADPEPDFIRQLKGSVPFDSNGALQMTNGMDEQAPSSIQHDEPVHQSHTTASMPSFIQDLPDFETPVNWADWDHLLADCNDFELGSTIDVDFMSF